MISFDPKTFYSALALIRIPRDPQIKVAKPSPDDEFGTGFFGTKNGVLFTVAHNLTKNGQPDGEPLPWVWVCCYNLNTRDWTDICEVKVDPSLIEPELDAAILLVDTEVSKPLYLAADWERGDNVVVLGFQPDSSKSSGYTVRWLFCEIPTNWDVAPYNLEDIYGEPTLRLGISALHRGQQPLGRGMSGGPGLNCECDGKPAIALVKAIEWPPQEQLRPPEVKTTALNWLRKLIVKLPAEKQPQFQAVARRQASLLPTSKRVSRRGFLKGAITGALVAAAAFTTSEYLLVKPGFLQLAAELFGRIFYPERSLLKTLFGAGFESTAIYSGSRYTDPKIVAWGLKMASSELCNTLKSIFGLKREDIPVIKTPEELETILGSLAALHPLCKIAKRHSFNIITIGSPIANDQTLRGMGYHPQKPWLVKNPLPFVFDFQSEKFEGMDWVKLKQMGHPKERKENWFIREVNLEKAKLGQFNDIREISKEDYLPVEGDERYKRDYALLAKIDSSEASGGKQIIIAGCHAEGTIVAAQALRNERILRKLVEDYKLKDEDNFAVLLQVEIPHPRAYISDTIANEGEDWARAWPISAMRQRGGQWTYAQRG